MLPHFVEGPVDEFILLLCSVWATLQMFAIIFI